MHFFRRSVLIAIKIYIQTEDTMAKSNNIVILYVGSALVLLSYLSRPVSTKLKLAPEL
jgi:hypothetical protein